MSAVAVDIQFHYADDFAARTDAVAGMERAARMWEAVLDDPVTVVIDVGEVPIAELGLVHAGTFVDLFVARYDAVREALIQDATSDADRTTALHLPDTSNLTFRAVEPDGTPALFNGRENINMYLALHAGLFGTFGGGGSNPDSSARIAWNTSFLEIAGLLDDDRSDGIDGADLVSIAAHEIGHALGFDSSAGVFDETSLPHGPFATEDQRDNAVLNMLDLFRYSPESLPHLDVAPGGDPFFSIDGGATPLAEFGSGIYNGDGDQAGHWQGHIGIMEASLAENTAHEFSELDLVAFDVIGWDVSPPLSGDYNASRAVEQGDLDLVLLHWGDDATAPPNDWLLNLPTGRVDQDELDAVLLGWGDTTTAAVSVEKVVEPCTILLALLAMLPSATILRSHMKVMQ